MAVKSSVVVAGATATVLVTGMGSYNVPHKVAIKPAADIEIGGSADQTFTVGTAGITLDLVAGDIVYHKRSGGADVNVDLLEVSI